MIAFGPVASRRLGQSLGINHIPPKSCTYDCVYCQVGPTHSKDLQRRPFYEPAKVINSVREKVEQIRAQKGRIDYLSFVPDGEPALDINLGRMIEELRTLNIKIAVITNGSLIWREDVRKELTLADCVSLKVDTVSEKVWRRINRPAESLVLEEILHGAMTFSKGYKGDLITETMLIAGVNDAAADLQQTAEFLGRLQPAVAYLAIPTRPPREQSAQAPGEQKLTEAWQIFSEQLPGRVEILSGYADESFGASGDAVQNLLDITYVHPMRESEVNALFRKAGVAMSVLEELIASGKITRVIHNKQAFYIRKLPHTT